MGYLGNVLAVLPDYRTFDVVIAHGDSLLLPIARRPLVRVLHGSALEEAMHATSPGRFLLSAASCSGAHGSALSIGHGRG